MSHVNLQKNQTVVVSRGGSPEPLAKIQVVELEAGKVTLDFVVAGQISILTLEEWERMQAGRRSNKQAAENTRTSHQAPYMK